jgi:hypothetical protein
MAGVTAKCGPRRISSGEASTPAEESGGISGHPQRPCGLEDCSGARLCHVDTGQEKELRIAD